MRERKQSGQGLGEHHACTLKKITVIKTQFDKHYTTSTMVFESKLALTENSPYSFENVCYWYLYLTEQLKLFIAVLWGDVVEADVSACGADS